MARLFVLMLVACFSHIGHADKLEMKWSSAGKKSGDFRHCIAINEPAEPIETSWNDNYLCFNKADHGFRYSYGGKISNMNCTSLNIKGGSWRDNYLCAKNHRIDFFARKLPGGYRCIQIIESSDSNPRANGSDGNSNHLCIQK